MHYPLVGERVWVSGCRDEFIVSRTDYPARVAAIALASDGGDIRNDVPFFLLFAHSDFKAALDGLASPAALREVLRSSRLCTHQAHVFVLEIRETIRTTMEIIRRSQALISASDQVIARWQMLDCKLDQRAE